MERFKTGDIVVNTQEDEWQGCVGVITASTNVDQWEVIYFRVPVDVIHAPSWSTPDRYLQLLTPRSEALVREAKNEKV